MKSEERREMETRRERSVSVRDQQNRPFRNRRIPVRLWLICAILACTALGVPTWSRYYTHIEGHSQGAVARMAGDSDITINLEELPTQPGESTDMKITVTNFEGASVCETGLSYTITLKSAGNLPLTFSLKPDSVDGGTSIQAGMLTRNTASQAGGLEAGKKNSHVYTITVVWPVQAAGEEADDADYKDEIDYVQIGIHASQIAPKG